MSDSTIRSLGDSTIRIVGEVPSGTIDDSNKIFTLAHTPTSGTVRLYLNGARMKITDDYSISTDTITFVTAPLIGSNILCDYEYK